MNDLISKEDLVYCIEKEDVQFEAKKRIGRELEDEEFKIIRKLLDNGISINMDIIYNTIFTEEIPPRGWASEAIFKVAVTAPAA